MVNPYGGPTIRIALSGERTAAHQRRPGVQIVKDRNGYSVIEGVAD